MKSLYRYATYCLLSSMIIGMIALISTPVAIGVSWTMIIGGSAGVIYSLKTGVEDAIR